MSSKRKSLERAAKSGDLGSKDGLWGFNSFSVESDRDSNEPSRSAQPSKKRKTGKEEEEEEEYVADFSDNEEMEDDVLRDVAPEELRVTASQGAALTTPFDQAWNGIIRGMIDYAQDLDPKTADFGNVDRTSISRDACRFLRAQSSSPEDIIAETLDAFRPGVREMLSNANTTVKDWLACDESRGPEFGIYMIGVIGPGDDFGFNNHAHVYVGQTLSRGRWKAKSNGYVGPKGFDSRLAHHEQAVARIRKGGKPAIEQALYTQAAKDKFEMAPRVLATFPWSEAPSFRLKGMITVMESALIVFCRSYAKQGGRKPSKAAFDLANQLRPVQPFWQAFSAPGLNRSFPLRDESFRVDDWKPVELRIVQDAANSATAHQLLADNGYNRSEAAVTRQRQRMGRGILDNKETKTRGARVAWTIESPDACHNAQSFEEWKTLAEMNDWPVRNTRAWREVHSNANYQKKRETLAKKKDTRFWSPEEVQTIKDCLTAGMSDKDAITAAVNAVKGSSWSNIDVVSKMNNLGYSLNRGITPNSRATPVTAHDDEDPLYKHNCILCNYGTNNASLMSRHRRAHEAET